MMRLAARLGCCFWIARFCLTATTRALIVLLLTAGAASAETPLDMTVRLSLSGRQIEGMPLRFDRREVHLLGRDGALWSFSPQEATDFQKTADGFVGYSHGELRGALQREFGKAFDVSGTGHYMVVHPAGQRDLWAERFEDLYRSFLHYFTARGFRPEPPKFPLIAIVCPTQADFARHALRDGIGSPAGLLGYYLPTTNRILLYDVTADEATAGGAKRATKVPTDWHQNAETLIHEAAHQVAFNTGVHSRYTMPPRWVAEGLGMLFEARGVWNSRDYKLPSDRVNRGRLQQFQRFANDRTPDSLATLVSSDRPFQTNVDRAYADAWAWTFYLCETEPRKYFEYLQNTARRPAFTTPSTAERLADFTGVFGVDFGMLEARMRRYMAELR